MNSLLMGQARARRDGWRRTLRALMPTLRQDSRRVLVADALDYVESSSELRQLFTGVRKFARLIKLFNLTGGGLGC